MPRYCPRTHADKCLEAVKRPRISAPIGSMRGRASNRDLLPWASVPTPEARGLTVPSCSRRTPPTLAGAA